MRALLLVMSPNTTRSTSSKVVVGNGATDEQAAADSRCGWAGARIRFPLFWATTLVIVFELADRSARRSRCPTTPTSGYCECGLDWTSCAVSSMVSPVASRLWCRL